MPQKALDVYVYVYQTLSSSWGWGLGTRLTLPYKTLYQTETPPLHVTNFSRFDQSEATFEMSCGIIPSMTRLTLVSCRARGLRGRDTHKTTRFSQKFPGISCYQGLYIIFQNFTIDILDIRYYQHYLSEDSNRQKAQSYLHATYLSGSICKNGLLVHDSYRQLP